MRALWLRGNGMTYHSLVEAGERSSWKDGVDCAQCVATRAGPVLRLLVDRGGDQVLRPGAVQPHAT